MKNAEITYNDIPLRPVFLNINYFNKENGPNFLYLGEQKVEIVSIIKKELDLHAK